MKADRAIFTVSTSEPFGDRIDVRMHDLQDYAETPFHVLAIGPANIHVDEGLVRRINAETSRWLAARATAEEADRSCPDPTCPGMLWVSSGTWRCPRCDRHGFTADLPEARKQARAAARAESPAGEPACLAAADGASRLNLPI